MDFNQHRRNRRPEPPWAAYDKAQCAWIETNRAKYGPTSADGDRMLADLTADVALTAQDRAHAITEAALDASIAALLKCPVRGACDLAELWELVCGENSSALEDYLPFGEFKAFTEAVTLLAERERNAGGING